MSYNKNSNHIYLLLFTRNIPMFNSQGKLKSLQVILEDVGNYHGAVMAAGTTDSNRQMGLSFFLIIGKEVF